MSTFVPATPSRRSISAIEAFSAGSRIGRVWRKTSGWIATPTATSPVTTPPATSHQARGSADASAMSRRTASVTPATDTPSPIHASRAQSPYESSRSP